MMTRSTEETLARARRLSTGQLSDVMDTLSIRRGGAIGIVPLEHGHRVAGRAFTVQYLPKEEVPTALPDYITQASPGDIFVISNRGRLDCSVWGGLRTTSAIARGVVGAVADGCYRDADEHLRARFPVWGRGRTMMNNHPYVKLAGVNVPVDIAGVRVMSGDLVVGDDSGVLFIPSADVGRVLDAAERVAARERGMVDSLTKGDTLEEARRKARS
jgi:4-hydroxy-4-methyl-2-oxoglutarate aldolase